jgi:hypothetical protein
MSITGIGSGSIWLWQGNGRAPLSSLFTPDSGSTSRAPLSSLFGLKPPPEVSTINQPLSADGPAVSSSLAQLFAVPANLNTANSELARLFAPGTDPAQVDTTSLLDWLRSLGAPAESSLLGSSTYTPIIGLPNQPDPSSAATDILFAFFDPQNALIGDILDAIG